MTVQTMNGNVAPPFRYCWTHFWSTSWSSNYSYDILFQILGSQKSSASNGMRFRGEMKKLWSFEDKRAKLSENFAAETPFGRVFRSCETIFGTRVPFCSTVPLLSKLRNELRNHFWATKWLWNDFQAAKWLWNDLQTSKWAVKSILGCEMISKLWNGCGITSKLKNGLQIANWLAKWKKVCKNTLQSQGKLLKYQQSLTTMHLKRRALCTLGSHTPSLSLHFWPP